MTIKNPFRLLLLTVTALIIVNGIISNNIFCGNMPGSMCWGSGWRAVMYEVTMILDYCVAVLFGVLTINEIGKIITTKLKGKQK